MIYIGPFQGVTGLSIASVATSTNINRLHSGNYTGEKEKILKLGDTEARCIWLKGLPAVYYNCRTIASNTKKIVGCYLHGVFTKCVAIKNVRLCSQLALIYQVVHCFLIGSDVKPRLRINKIIPEMSGKTLSTGTLSLRFMQNANRAKHLKEFELDRAEVVDAGKWEIGQDIRDTWGPIPNSSSCVVFSDSHLSDKNNYYAGKRSSTNHLISLSFSQSPSKISQSRWKLKLYPIVQKVAAPSIGRERKLRRCSGRYSPLSYSLILWEQVAAEGSSEIPSDTASPSPDRNSSRKVHPRPVAISFATTSSLHGLEEPKKHSKTAKQTIFENSNVGADIRSLSLAKPQPPVHPPLPNVFLKPAGIDDPLESKAPLSSEKAEPSIIDGARRKKPKRPRDPADPTHEENKRGRKKKKAIES